jgi:hypothetical protein
MLISASFSARLLSKRTFSFYDAVHCRQAAVLNISTKEKSRSPEKGPRFFSCLLSFRECQPSRNSRTSACYKADFHARMGLGFSSFRAAKTILLEDVEVALYRWDYLLKS